jgi:parallel beta-helix repeat protein
MLRSRWLVIGAVGALVAAAPAAQAKGGAHLACGDVVTTSVKLKHDLVGCHATGLVVGADGITIDLGGHTISGSNEHGSVGIADEGHRNVTVERGTIAGFFTAGITFQGAPHSAVHRVLIVRTGDGGVEPETSAGVHVEQSPGFRITRSTVVNDVKAFQVDGVVVLRSPGSLIRGNRLSHNAWNGAVVLESADVRVAGNVLDGNGNNGLEANGASDRVVVAGNLVRGNTQFGLVVGSLAGARVIGNRIARSGAHGLLLFDLADSLIAGNRSDGNEIGIDLAGGQFGSHGNALLHNRTSANRDSGIVVEGRADRNRVVGNDASRNVAKDGAGIVIAVSSGNVLRRNVVNRNAGDGIAMFSDAPGDTTGNTIARTTARKNGGHGINALDGTIDGGGNRAAGNATPPDCVNIACH